MATEKKARLAPEAMSEGGGLLDDFTATWSDVKWEMFDYQGKSMPAPTLKITMELEEGDSVDQYWSVGSNKDWMPSKDGSYLVSVGTAEGIRKSSNCGIFMTSMSNAGFPGDKWGEVEDNVKCLVGLVAHHIRVPAPKREGLAGGGRKRADGTEYDRTILTVSEIKQLPWEEAGQKASGKKATRKAGGKAASKEAKGEVDEDMASAATNFVMEQIAEAGEKGVLKKDLPTLAFKVFAQQPLAWRSEMVKLVFDDGFLGSGPWTYEDGIVKMG